jgi:alpha-glucosidase (family GH31 glycosyl hydrolase)
MGQLVQQRLKFSRYIYSQMYQVFREGGALVRPLFFDYPTDDQAFDNVDNNFMLGDALKVSPVLDQGVTGPYQSYFPAGQWFDLNNMLSTNGSNIIKIDKGGM